MGKKDSVQPGASQTEMPMLCRDGACPSRQQCFRWYEKYPDAPPIYARYFREEDDLFCDKYAWKKEMV